MHAHNYMSWQPKHIISSVSTLGTWQTAMHTSIHASANNNISFVRQREAILCKTDCMERKIIPFMPFTCLFVFLHFPTHTQIKLMVHTKDFMLMFSWLNKIGSRKTKTKKHEFLPLCRASSGCLPTWCLTKCGATPCFSILAWPPTGYFSHGDRVTKITWHGSLSAGGRGSEE